MKLLSLYGPKLARIYLRLKIELSTLENFKTPGNIELKLYEVHICIHVPLLIAKGINFEKKIQKRPALFNTYLDARHLDGGCRHRWDRRCV